jgi:hypothetical protein
MTAGALDLTSKAHAFMTGVRAPLNSNSPWGQRYAHDVRRVVHNYAARAPRTLQQHLGPSELGAICDRQVAAKMAGFPATNNVVDPWPSIIGTAVHAWLADAFAYDNPAGGPIRFVPETRVVPFDGHSGTADLYDYTERAVVDHKILGVTSMAKVRAPEGPPRRYVVQLLLYGRGYRNLGLPVHRVALAAYPRTAASLDGLYIWERPYTPADDELLAEVWEQTISRKRIAVALLRGDMTISDVPATPNDTECYFCPFYRPQVAQDGGYGCAGTVGNRLSVVPD